MVWVLEELHLLPL